VPLQTGLNAQGAGSRLGTNLNVPNRIGGSVQVKLVLFSLSCVRCEYVAFVDSSISKQNHHECNSTVIL
jgi:hypothetical protein